MKDSAWRLCIVAGLVASLAAGCSLRPNTPAVAFAELPDRTQTVLQPGAVAPLRAAGPLPEYRLALALDTTTRRLAGREQVRYPNRTSVALNEIVFRLYPNLPQYEGELRVGEVWVNGRLAGTALRAESTSLAVALPEALAPNASTVVSLTFEVDLPAKDDGYVLFGYSQGVWTAPDAYPLLAVHDGLTWHEDIAPAHGDAVFAGAADYDVTLSLPPDLVVAATGSTVETAEEADGRRTYRMAGYGLREFAWFGSAGYQVAETTAYGTRLRSYYLPGDESAGQAVLTVAAAALRAYGDAFGAYPYAEMQVVEAPLLYYGMEFPGLNLIGVDLYREHRDELEMRVAHEIAHQWWYGEVGSDQVNVPWLDEGLAEQSTATYYRAVYGEAQANTLVNQRWLVPYQSAVEAGIDAVVNQPAVAFGPEYEVIVYAKAALFFEALRQQLGEEGYRRVLRAYLDRYLWRIATPDGLLAAAEAASGQELDGLYTHWILSKQ